MEYGEMGSIKTPNNDHHTFLSKSFTCFVFTEAARIPSLLVYNIHRIVVPISLRIRP
jgi:hypothetical protein